MQNAAQLALAAVDLKAAAVAVADMAQACGGCHLALSGPNFSGSSPAGEESSVVADMERHRWAADRMWEGLVGPSETAWLAGAATLEDAPRHPEAMVDDKTPLAEKPGVKSGSAAACWWALGTKVASSGDDDFLYETQPPPARSSARRRRTGLRRR